MRVLVLTNMYPTPSTPTEGVFIAEQVESIRALGVEVRTLHADRTVRGMSAYRDLARRTRADVASFRPDVVHATYGGILALQAQRGAPTTALVVSFCGSDLLGEPSSPALTRLSARMGVTASRRVARRADAVIVKSPSLRDALPDRVDRSLVSVIPNGVSLGRFRPLDRDECRNRLGWLGPGPQVMFAGQPRKVKRPELAAAAVDELRAEMPGIELHIPDGVSRELMPVWLNAADAVVLTSRHEGSPNVIKEAMACETPIVSVAVGDVAERLEGAPNSQVVEDGATEIAEGLRAVLAAPRQPGQRAAVGALSLDAVARQVVDCYDTALVRRGRRTHGAR